MISQLVSYMTKALRRLSSHPKTNPSPKVGSPQSDVRIGISSREKIFLCGDVEDTRPISAIADASAPTTGQLILPAGVKHVSHGYRHSEYINIWFEVPHGVYNLRCQDGVSSEELRAFRRRTYNNYQLALPYMEFNLVINNYDYDKLWRMDMVEMYWRPAPLTSMDDLLYIPIIYNSMRSGLCLGHPGKIFNNVNDMIINAVAFVKKEYFARSFNDDGDSNNYDNYASGRMDTPKRWQKNTLKDPSFILRENWTKGKGTSFRDALKTHSGHTLSYACMDKILFQYGR